jgi:hypothetical protein
MSIGSARCAIRFLHLLENNLGDETRPGRDSGHRVVRENIQYLLCITNRVWVPTSPNRLIRAARVISRAMILAANASCTIRWQNSTPNSGRFASWSSKYRVNETAPVLINDSSAEVPALNTLPLSGSGSV